MPGGSAASGHHDAQLRGGAALEAEQVVTSEKLKVELDWSFAEARRHERDLQRRPREERAPADGDGAGGFALLAGPHDPLRPYLLQRRAAIADPIVAGDEGRQPQH